MKKLQDSADEINKNFSGGNFEQKLHTDFKNRLGPRASYCVRLKGQQKHRAQRKVGDHLVSWNMNKLLLA